MCLDGNLAVGAEDVQRADVPVVDVVDQLLDRPGQSLPVIFGERLMVCRESPDTLGTLLLLEVTASSSVRMSQAEVSRKKLANQSFLWRIKPRTNAMFSVW
jgi:hypothetical protein